MYFPSFSLANKLQKLLLGIHPTFFLNVEALKFSELYTFGVYFFPPMMSRMFPTAATCSITANHIRLRHLTRCATQPSPLARRSLLYGYKPLKAIHTNLRFCFRCSGTALSLHTKVKSVIVNKELACWWDILLSSCLRHFGPDDRGLVWPIKCWLAQLSAVLVGFDAAFSSAEGRRKCIELPRTRSWSWAFTNTTQTVAVAPSLNPRWPKSSPEPLSMWALLPLPEHPIFHTGANPGAEPRVHCTFADFWGLHEQMVCLAKESLSCPNTRWSWASQKCALQVLRAAVVAGHDL